MIGTRVLVAALSLGFVSVASTEAAPNPKLSSKCEYTVGDDIAQRMAGGLRVAAGIEETPLVYYDREKQRVVAELFGSTDKVEEAKRDLGGLVEVIQTEVAGYAKRHHHVDLTDMDVTLIYYVDSDQGAPEEVVRREEGRFVVPKDDEQER